MVTFAQAQERAERWVNGDVPAYQTREIRVREFDLGFVVWSEPREGGMSSDEGAVRVVIARDSGEATLWPALPIGELIRRYEEEYGPVPGDAVPEPPQRIDLEATSFLLSPPQWLQDAADRMGIPDRRSSTPGADHGSPATSGQSSGAQSPSSGGIDYRRPAAAAAPDTSAATAEPAEPAAPAAARSGGHGAEAGRGSAPVPGAGSGIDYRRPGRRTSGPAGPDQPARGTGAEPGGGWAGKTVSDSGEGQSVAVPATVFAPPVIGEEESGDVSQGSEARTQLLPGGSGLPNTLIAPPPEPLPGPQGPGAPHTVGGSPYPPPGGDPVQLPPPGGARPGAADIADLETARAAPRGYVPPAGPPVRSPDAPPPPGAGTPPPPSGTGTPPPPGPGTNDPHYAATMLAGPGTPPPPPGQGGPAMAPPPPPPGYGYPQPANVPTVGPGYMAVLRYRGQDGSEQQLIRRSAPGTPHPEWQILHELRSLNVRPEQVLELHTELESCDLPGGYCTRMIRETWPQVRISHTAPYGRDHASRRQGVQHLLTHQGELHQVAGAPARPQPQRVPMPDPHTVLRVPPVPLEVIGQELAGAFGPQAVFRFDQRAVSRQGVPDIVAQCLVWAGLPVDFGPFFWAQAQPGQPVPTLAELAGQRGVQPAADAGSYLVMGTDFGRQLCVQYGTAHIVAVPLEAGPGGQPPVPQFVNSSLPEFTRSLALLGRMWRLRIGLTPDQAGRWTVDFQAQLAAQDPAAIASPDNWWPVLIEQMWDGLL